MARRATRQNVGLLNLIFAEQRSPLVQLLAGAVLWSPFHVEDLVRRSDKLLGVPVTAHTPLHLQRRRLVSDGHLIDSTMASGASDSLVHMNAVVEIGIVGEIVDPNPLNRLAGAKAGTNRFQIRTISPDLLVTVHAGFG